MNPPDHEPEGPRIAEIRIVAVLDGYRWFCDCGEPHAPRIERLHYNALEFARHHVLDHIDRGGDAYITYNGKRVSA